MNITPEELVRIRAIAESDRDGADGKAWDEAITPDTVIALCDEMLSLWEKCAEWEARAQWLKHIASCWDDTARGRKHV